MGWHAATGLERTLFQGGDWGFGIGDSKEQEHPVFPVLCQCRHVPAFPNPQSRIPNPRLQRTNVPISSPRSTRSSTPDWLMSKMRSGRLLSRARAKRSEEHTSELQSLMRISYAVFCLKKKNKQIHKYTTTIL